MIKATFVRWDFTKHEKIMVLRGEALDANVLQGQVDALLEITCTYNSVSRKARQVRKAITMETLCGLGGLCEK